MVRAAPDNVENYRQRLNRNPDWALWEGGMHFEENNSVHNTLRNITSRLRDKQIAYAVVGGMALFQHGHRRFTEDVDLLVTAEGLKAAHDQLEGIGYVRAFAGSKRLKDATTGVQIDFLITGQFPGDGKPKPVAFPDPQGSTIELSGMQVLTLPRLVELKLASGMTGGVNRMKDLTDVVELIKAVPLSYAFGEELNPFVRGKYLELWNELAANPAPFES